MPMHIVPHGAEHDHTAAERELGMGNLVLAMRRHKTPFKTEYAAQPFDSGMRIAVAQTGNNGRPGCFLLHGLWPL